MYNIQQCWDFPGGPVVKNLPSNAGDAGSIPGWGTKIPHAEGHLSLCAATAEPTCSGTHAPQLERKKTCMLQLERSPRTTTKSPSAATKTRRSQKYK